MRDRYIDLAFTPAVQAEQTRQGSRAGYADFAARSAGAAPPGLTEAEAAFVAARDSFYLASVSETGWPYVQHRGGPAGFLRVLDPTTLGWAEYQGNRQYISAGNVATDDRVSMILMDYPNRSRLKVFGHLRLYGPEERPELLPVLTDGVGRRRVERLAIVTVAAFDWNCPQHITPRYTVAEVAAAVAPLQARIAELERQLAEAA